jgi:hypothetical protein
MKEIGRLCHKPPRRPVTVVLHGEFSRSPGNGLFFVLIVFFSFVEGVFQLVKAHVTSEAAKTKSRHILLGQYLWNFFNYYLVFMGR